MKRLILFSAIGMTACLFDSDKEDEIITEGDDNFLPTEGRWLIENPNITNDNCGFDNDSDTAESEEELDPAILELTQSGFTLTIQTEDEVKGEDENSEDPITLNCSLDEMDFDCNSEPVSMEVLEDALMIQVFHFTGAFQSSTALSGDVVVSVGCEGAGCDELSDFGITIPCEMSGSTAATFEE